MQFFCAGEEFLLIFRGEVFDHHVMLSEGESFVHATCMLSRAPDPLEVDLARYLLEWNARHSMARTAISGSELLLAADIPCHGLQAAGVEELILGVAAAAEELSRDLLPRLLGGDASIPTSTADDLAVAQNEPPVPEESPEREGPPKAPLPSADDTEIDWNAEDI